MKMTSPEKSEDKNPSDLGRRGFLKNELLGVAAAAQGKEAGSTECY